MLDRLPPKRAVIPGALACLALLGLGLAAGSHIGGSAKAAPRSGAYTTTISGRIVTVKGKAAKILIPAKTIRRNGTTITIPAHTVAITDVQTVSGPAQTIDGTVFRTVKVPVTITGPGTTITATQTVAGPVTTIVSTVIDTTTDTVTETVTAPPAT
jgi:flagellar capping protein FliD